MRSILYGKVRFWSALAGWAGCMAVHSQTAPSHPPEINGSGTSWLPPAAAVHEHALQGNLGTWNLMFHGDALLRYTRQNANHTGRWDSGTPAPRGGEKIDGPNWMMLRAARPLPGGATLELRSMLSLDPLTEGKRGYPLLFQTGEGMVDRQHAHDLFMELSLLYSLSLGGSRAAFLYLGLPGEPALGPPAFMHRPSAAANPDAPLSHHMQDATHITFGVITAGWIIGDNKLDASAFRGREPDNRRLDIERPWLDSYSLRFSRHLRPDLTAQVSAGRMNDAENADMPMAMNMTRLSASLDFTRTRGSSPGRFSAALIYGVNFHDGMHHGDASTQSMAGEGEYDEGKVSLWTRWESLQRIPDDLDLARPAGESFWIHAWTAGASHRLVKAAGCELLLGAQGTLHLAADAEEEYGDHPLAYQVFLRLRPAPEAEHHPAGGHRHRPGKRGAPRSYLPISTQGGSP